jgi:2'-hydroxyisoflavone reductase
MAELIYGIRAVTTEPTTFTWVDADFLGEQGVRPWSDMPCWVPPVGDTAGFARFSSAKAQARGLTYRPLATTTRATLDWHATRPAEETAELRSGLSPEREAEVLEAWHGRQA